MFIHYSGTNVHSMGLVNSTQMKMNQSPQEVRWLQPGWNEIPTKIWDQNKTNPTIKNMLTRGVIKILPDQVQVKFKKAGKITKKKLAIGEHDKPIALSLFEEKRAIEIVKDTYNRDILQRWEDEETRIKVRKALNKQLAPLLPSESDDDQESESSQEEEYYE